MGKNDWGSIINISSDVAADGMIDFGSYDVVKSALFGFTANLVTELCGNGILSNVVIPSWRAKMFFPQHFLEKAVDTFPTGRITQPKDVASIIVYPGSDTNRHVNDEYIRVTGKGSLPMLSYFMNGLKQ